MSTMKDIARVTNLSVSSVSYALNGKGSLSEETVRIVQDAARRLNYKPNRMARRLKTGVSNLIGVIVNLDDLVNYSNKILNHLNALSTQNGYTLIVVHNGRFDEDINFLVENKVNGIIYLSTNYIDRDIFRLYELAAPEVPMVFINTWHEEYADSCVFYDEHKALHDITAMLLDKNHRRIGCITGERDWEATKLRLQGFLDALRERGADDSVVNRTDESAGNVRFGSYYVSQQDRVETMARELISGGASAIVCFNDIIATTVYKVARELGLQIPADLSVTGFDNQILTNFLIPRLATVDIPVEGLSDAAFKLLLSKMKGTGEFRECSIGCTIVENESTGPAA